MTPDPHRTHKVESRLARAFKAGTLPKELVICGAAGTGKTVGYLRLIHALSREVPGFRVLIARQTRRSLTDSVLKTYEEEILANDSYLTNRGRVPFTKIAANCHRKNRSSYDYPNGSEWVLAGLEDHDKVKSTAWDIVFVNECTEAQQEAWQEVKARLGRPGRSMRFGYLLGDCNPGDPSHWIKTRADAGDLAMWDTSHEANPRMWSRETRDWTDEGLNYLKQLDGLTGTTRQRLRWGLWAAGDASWFPGFDMGKHVTPIAEYDPRFPVHLAADNNGLHTGAVWFQVRPGDDGPVITVFGDYFNPAGHIDGYRKAQEILERGKALCGGRYDYGTHDPAAGARLGFNVTISGEYERAGLKLNPWPTYPGSVVTGLTLVESFVGDGLIVHPRCVHLIAAMTNYRRKMRNGQYIDEPESPMHPHEDLLDALRGGLLAHFPEGRRPRPKLTQMRAGRVF